MFDPVLVFLRGGLIMAPRNSWVQTELGNRGADAFGIEKAAITVEESVTGVVEVIDASTLETHSGKLFRYHDSM
ncbi:hypothetical protein ACN38_g4335 [Penicillium nordicum]|uniref:Uncharacterized protein n=1 Tax=Penicillium nordicum TaxID=229535 RepID=A0A0M8PBL3_9EURO|nr:hypothetical protein ACN38_g4335 [Penicillium nordicum]